MGDKRTKILITGSTGFLGKNLLLGLRSRGYQNVLTWDRSSSIEELRQLACQTEVIFHLAGVNRSNDPTEFDLNRFYAHELMEGICAEAGEGPKRIIAASSVQVSTEQNAYSKSKREAEQIFYGEVRRNNTQTICVRFPRIFGKWARPHHNSFVATFCHQLLNNEEPELVNQFDVFHLAYIDVVIDFLIGLINSDSFPDGGHLIDFPDTLCHVTSVFDVYQKLSYLKSRVLSGDVPLLTDLIDKQLFATLVSYLSAGQQQSTKFFHEDPRGKFVELAHMQDYGQISVFSINPGCTRGGHFHNTKVEVFTVLQGQVVFHYRNLAQNTEKTITLKAGEVAPQLFSIPGEEHILSNPTNDLAWVMVWASEIYDPKHPDTFITGNDSIL